jgi:hypothetical protein
LDWVKILREQQKHLALCPCCGFGAKALNDSQRRQNDQPPPEFLHHRLYQEDSSSGL